MTGTREAGAGVRNFSLLQSVQTGCEARSASYSTGTGVPVGLTQQNSTYPDTGYPDLLGCREFYKTNLPWYYWLSDQVQYSAMASRTASRAWSNGVDARTYCK